MSKKQELTLSNAHNYFYTNKEACKEVKDYLGGPELLLNCTQLDDETASRKKKIVDEWCDFLSTEKTSLKKVFVGRRINQKIFEALCNQDQLEFLYINWGAYTDISQISKLQKLKKVYLGSGGRIKNLDALTGLKNITALGFEGLYSIEDYDFVSQFKNLEELNISGDPYGSMKKVKVKSLNFLKDLPLITHLELVMTNILDHSYLPVLDLPNLKTFEYTPRDRDLKKDIDKFSHLLHS